MPSYTIYANADDYTYESADADWNTARAGSNLFRQNSSDDPGFVCAYYDGAIYLIQQHRLKFDTSGVVGTETATSLVISVQAVYSGGISAVECREKTLDTSYVAGASLAGLTQFSSSSVAFTSTGTKTFTKATPAISRSATYGLILYDQLVRTNTPPTDPTQAAIHTANATGTTNDPHLSITTISAVSLTVGNASHAHTATSPTLAAKSTLSSNGATHAHAATSPALSFVPGVTPGNAVHAHTATSPSINASVPVAIDGCTHGHEATSPELIPHAVLAVNDNEHSHEATTPALAFGTVLEIDFSSHGHTATAPRIAFVGWINADLPEPGWTSEDPDDGIWTVQPPAASAWA